MKKRGRSPTPPRAAKKQKDTPSPSSRTFTRKTGCGVVYPGMSLGPLLKYRTAPYFVPDGDKNYVFSFCDKDTRLVDIKKLDRSSGSDTMQFFAGLRGATQKLMLKMSFRAKNPKKDNSLEIERMVYKKVTNPLLLNKNTPHLIAYYATTKCINYEAANPRSYIVDLAEIRASGYNTKSMFVLALERANGKQLAHYMDDTDYLYPMETFWQPILFQLAWTLRCFKDVGLMHNDLHAGNLFIDTATPKQLRRYVSRNRCYVTHSVYSLKIFDYDYSSKMRTRYDSCILKNTYLKTEACKALGLCNRYDQRIDLTRILYNIAQHAVLNDYTELSNYLRYLGVNIAKLLEFEPPQYAHHGIPMRLYANDTRRTVSLVDVVPTLDEFLAKAGEPFEKACDEMQVTEEQTWMLPSVQQR